MTRRKRAPRQTIARFGQHGRTVRVFTEPRLGLVRVRWYDGAGQERTRSWRPNTREQREAATLWAKTFAAERDGGGQAMLTLRQLWEAYTEAEFDHLKPRTQALYRWRWGKWEVALGATRLADETNIRDVSRFKRLARDAGLAPNQVLECLKVVKLVYAWGHRHEQLARNRLARLQLRLRSGEFRHEPPAYTPEEFERILGHFDPRKASEWRPWAVLLFLGHQGVRETPAVKLERTDLAGAVVHWPQATDKTGEAWDQPLRWGAIAALETARGWAEHDGYPGPYVFYGRGGKGHYTAQALIAALHRAERAAGVPSIAYRGAHGLRRMVATEIWQATGDPLLALRFIHDKDVRRVREYLKSGLRELEGVARLLDGTETRTKPERPRVGSVPQASEVEGVT